MSGGWFITGTDTGVGKTCVSLALIHALRAAGRVVVAMKPVASGCVDRGQGLRNEDAECLSAASSRASGYQLVNPYAFEPAIAPHLAAEAVATRIEIPCIENSYRQLAAEADDVVVEGVGGWLVPINDNESMQDVARVLRLPVLLVVGIRLGCLNHALLTDMAVRASGLTLAGWVANRVDRNCENAEDNVRALRKRLAAPLVADFDYDEDPAWPREKFQALDLDRLLANRASS